MAFHLSQQTNLDRIGLPSFIIAKKNLLDIKINLQLNTATTHKVTADKPVAARETSS